MEGTGRRMKPCDCNSMHEAETKLREQGLSFGDSSIMLYPSSVILTIGSCTIKMPQSHFRRFAEWYFEDQSDL